MPPPSSEYSTPEVAPAAIPSFLAHIRVLQIGSTLTLQLASQVFEQFGAQVERLDSRDATPEVLSRANADVVLVDRIGGPVDLPGIPARTAAEYLEFVEQANRSVWVTASAFGLTTSRADAVGSDVSILASAGILGHSRIGDEWPPTIPAGSLGLKLVGNMMVMAALNAMHELLSGGSPVHVDISAQAAVVVSGLTLEMAHALLECPDEGGSARYGAPTGFFECQDGAIYVVVLEQHQWRGFQSVLVPALDEINTVEDGRRRHIEVNQATAAWAATRTAEECERTLQAAGVACTAVNTVQELITRSNDAKRPLALGADTATPMPARVSCAPMPPAPKADKHCHVALEDLKVLDAGHVLAVPLATAWLGAMGADVVKLEDPERLDVYRRRGPFAEGIPGLNRSAYFNAINFCKRPLDVAVTPEGSSLDLTDFDVVVHNLSPRRAKQVGVDSEAVIASGDAKMHVSSSGFGATGAWATYRAYGHNIHAFSGLVAATQDARGDMADVGTPWCDPLTSVAITTWILAWSLAPSRERGLAVDISMAELMASQLEDLVGIEPDANYRASPSSLDFFTKEPNTDRVIAITLTGERMKERFEALFGCKIPPLDRRGQWVDLPLSALGELQGEDFEGRLISEGFAASIVRTATDLSRDLFLRGTGLFREVQSATLGHHELAGLPWKFVGRERAGLRAAPERRDAE